MVTASELRRWLFIRGYARLNRFARARTTARTTIGLTARKIHTGAPLSHDRLSVSFSGAPLGAQGSCSVFDERVRSRLLPSGKHSVLRTIAIRSAATRSRRPNSRAEKSQCEGCRATDREACLRFQGQTAARCKSARGAINDDCAPITRLGFVPTSTAPAATPARRRAEPLQWPSIFPLLA